MGLAKILLVLEWISFIVGLLTISKIGKNGRFIVYYLGVVVLSESVGLLARYIIADSVKMVHFIKAWFNVLNPMQCLWLLVFYYLETKFAYWRLTIAGFIGIQFFILFLQLFTGDLTQLNTFNYTLEAIFISACSLHYLFEMMNREEIDKVTRDPFLYVSIGLLLFYLGTLPFNSMRTYLYVAHRNIFYIYYYLFFGFNYFLYSIITFGFLWTKKK